MMITYDINNYFKAWSGFLGVIHIISRLQSSDCVDHNVSSCFDFHKGNACCEHLKIDKGIVKK